MKALTALLAVLLVLAIGVIAWVVARPNPAAGELGRLERELATAQSEITRLHAALASTNAPGKAKAGSAPDALETVAAKATPASAPDTPDATPAKPPRRANPMRAMLENPGMKDMLKQQILVQNDMIYGRLFDEFQLNPEERENLRQLLGARSAAQQELGLKLMDENLTGEQRRQIMDDHEAAKKASDDAIRTFLSHEPDYQRFQYWEDSAPERMAFEMMGGRSHFATAGEPLTPAQEQQLIDTMVAVRKSPSDLPDLTKPENISPGNLSDDMIARQLAHFDRSAQAVAERAGGYLSPAQLQGLLKFYEQQRTLAETGLKMSNAMLKADP